MNRIEITETLKLLREYRTAWINENRIPIEDWSKSPYQLEMSRLGTLLQKCWDNNCECDPIIHEMTHLSPTGIRVYESKGMGNWEACFVFEIERLKLVKDTLIRKRMGDRAKWMRRGAMSVDKGTLAMWKIRARDGNEFWISRLKERDIALKEKHEAKTRSQSL